MPPDIWAWADTAAKASIAAVAVNRVFIAFSLKKWWKSRIRCFMDSTVRGDTSGLLTCIKGRRR
jgi:hypothetical protein